MFKFAQISLPKKSFFKGIGLLNNLTKNSLILNLTPLKVNFSTKEKSDISYFQQNMSNSLREMSFDNSYIFSEFGAKKKSSENLEINEEIIEQNSERISEKKTKKSPPKTESKTDKTKKSPAKSKEDTEKGKMEKADKNANKIKKVEKKTKTSSTLDENEKNAEGNFKFFKTH